MKKKYPIESLLRPAVECWSVFICLISTLLLYFYPGTFSQHAFIAHSLALIIALIGFKQLYDAVYILRYQRNIRRRKSYRVCTDCIPFSKRKMLLGRGFAWRQKHTQRLRDTLRPEAEKYTRSSSFYQWARKMELKYEHRSVISKLTGLLSCNRWWNPVKPTALSGGSTALHGIELNEKEIWIDLEARHGHTFISGTTGVGKTRLCEFLVTQDIRRGDTTIVICPKGDAGLFKRVYAEAIRAGRHFYCFHLGYPQASCRYNGVGSFTRITEVATRIANQLPDEGNAAAFKEFSWRFINIVAQALTQLGERCSYANILGYIYDCEPLFEKYAVFFFQKTGLNNWKSTVEILERKIHNRKNNKNGRPARAQAIAAFIRQMRLSDSVLTGLRRVIEYDREYYNKLVASVGPLLEKLITGRVADLISPDYQDTSDSRPLLDWMTAIRQKAVVYIGLDGLTDMTVASAVGNSMFADLVSVTGRIYKYGIAEEQDLKKDIEYPTVRIHADEFSALAGDEFIPLLNRSRGAGVDVVAYTQTMSDIEAGTGSPFKARQITGNFNTFGLMRVPDAETAAIIIEKLPLVEVMSKWQVSSADDSSDPSDRVLFRAKNEDRITGAEVPMLEPANFVSLPKGEAFFITEGGRLYKIRIPLLLNNENDVVPESIGQIIEDMKRRYNPFLPNENVWWEPGK